MTPGERSRTAAPGAHGTIVSVNVSRRKGQAKTPVAEALAVAGEGLREDAHRGFGHRQVSLLMLESIEKQKARLGEGAAKAIGPGAYAENLTTRGLDLKAVKVGDELLVRGQGGNVLLRVSQIGKDCHTKCAIFKIAGDCIMPGLGVFCEVLEGGKVTAGDSIEKR
jgi:molybdopterin adenylyltransferase